MDVLLRLSLWRRAAWALGILVLISAGGKSAYAQVGADTAEADVNVSPPAPLDSVQTEDVAAPDTSEPQRAIVTADSLSAMVRDGERLQELFRNVDVRQDTTRLRSNYGLRYLQRDELLFTGDVVIYERGDTLRADTVWYNKKTKVGRARSDVRLTDGEVVVRAPEAIYYTKKKRSVFRDSVTLVDSNRVLRAQEGTYWSNDRRANFRGNVRLTDENTHLEADSLTYFRDQERSIATGSVFIRRVETEQMPAAASPELADTTTRPVDTTSTVVDTGGAAPDTTSLTADTTSAPADTISRATDPGTGPADTASVAVDTTSITYLFGEWADNQEQNRYSRVERQAVLVRVRLDSTGAPDDTLAVRAHVLEANRTDTYHRLVAVDSVRTWQADLATVADSAVYDRVVETGAPDSTVDSSPLPDTTVRSPPDSERRYDSPLDSLVAQAELIGVAWDARSSPEHTARTSKPSDTSRIKPSGASSIADADTTSPTDTTRRSMAQERPAPDSGAKDDMSEASGRNAQHGRTRPIWDTPSVQSEDELPLEETRLFRDPITWFERSQTWGDSIRVRAENRSLDTVYVRGSAFAAQEDTTVDRIRQLKGRNITAFFHRDVLRRIRAEPNGESIYFSASATGTLNGATRASADYVELFFRGQDVDRIKFGSGVQGSAYHKKKHIPDPFRLDGFQWTPERRPTRASLLREKRVRERLDLDPAPDDRAPPVAQASPERQSPADTLAQPDSTVQADSVAQRSEGRQGANKGRQPVQQSGSSQGTPGERSSARPDSLAAPPDSIRKSPDDGGRRFDQHQ